MMQLPTEDVKRGARIAGALKIRGITFRKIAKELGVASGSVGGVVYGRSRSAKIQAYITDTLGIPWDETSVPEGASQAPVPVPTPSEIAPPLWMDCLRWSYIAAEDLLDAKAPGAVPSMDFVAGIYRAVGKRKIFPVDGGVESQFMPELADAARQIWERYERNGNTRILVTHRTWAALKPTD